MSISTADTVRTEITGSVRTLIQVSPGDSVKARIRAAARRLGLPFGRTQDYWHGEVRRIDAHEADNIRAYVRAAEKLLKAREEYEAIRMAYLATAPEILLRLAPRPLGGNSASEEAAAVIAAEAANHTGTRD